MSSDNDQGTKCIPRARTADDPVSPEAVRYAMVAGQLRFDLADVEPHQKQNARQRRIIDALPRLWYTAEDTGQYASEQSFIDAFFRFHGQQRALERRDEIYLVPSASVGVLVTATYLRKKGLSVALMEPCFDGLHDLLDHMRVPLSPLRQELLAQTSSIYANLVAHASGVDAIVLVDPGDPTGSSLFSTGSEAFLEVLRFCVDHDKLLVLDLCFAGFIMTGVRRRCDVYALMEDAGVRYIALEDTGKAWPMQGARCATVMASRDVDADLYPIVTSMRPGVSPFVLALATRYVRDSAEDGFASVRDLLEVNRHVARQKLDGIHLSYCEPDVATSVAWFEINDPRCMADSLQAQLLEQGIRVASGSLFYWHDPARGQRYLRIALARDPDLFSESISALAKALATYRSR